MTSRFFEQPILNPPYSIPTRHHPLDKNGQPLEQPPVEGRRPSSFIAPVPRPRTRRDGGNDDQIAMPLGVGEGLSGG
jgi:type III restriction enzyme